MKDRESREQGPAAVLSGHPALFLTVGYLLISLLGLSFEWTLFRQFGINFFYFAEVTDFLMGAFREPITFLLSATALIVGWLTYFWDRAERDWLAKKRPGGWFLERYRRYANSRFNRLAPAVFFVGYSIMFIWLHAEHRAEELRGGEVAQVTVRMADGSEPRRLHLLGTSSRFVFFYKARSDETVIVPLESIASIGAAAGGH
jgi:hypothetical protein